MSPHAEVTTSTDRYEYRDSEMSSHQFTEQLRPANGHLNGHTNNHTQNRSHLRRIESDEPYDLICVGFGPANLALAIALHDALDDPSHTPARLHSRPPKVLFVEKQEHYGWHEGMLLPGATMQISFIKDLATLRNPRSEFTFINYLHRKDRLLPFTNLDTFLPQRIEYADYMKWCAGWFDEVVEYRREVVQVTPKTQSAKSSRTDSFLVETRDTKSGETQSFQAKHVVVAVGGKPNIPEPFPSNHPKVLHSSWYANAIHKVLKDPSREYRIAVVGGGQSAAEIFNDLHTRYPNSHTRLVMKAAALKPSDDSPFVNELFDPIRVDSFYPQSSTQRHAQISANRATNYGVVRPKLIDHLYETLYMQRLAHPNEADWPHRILKNRAVVAVETASSSSSPSSAATVELLLRDTATDTQSNASLLEETLTVDAVVVAAGYLRDAHEALLAPARGLMPGGYAKGKKWAVRRDYGVVFEEGAVGGDAGVWLAGCNESTHGLSDSLLSILATRGGDLVNSIFSD